MPITFENLPTDQPNEVWVGAIEVQIVTPDGKPRAHVPYQLEIEGGATFKGRTDAEGRLRATGLPPGASATLTLPDTPLAVREDTSA
ncbi:MAG: hypothetical protein D6776_07695 [Planctomycetota bacterium]|nr:MAG: hypothetical protein D6776_07695 [Planctomycetota bacterium]